MQKLTIIFGVIINIIIVTVVIWYIYLIESLKYILPYNVLMVYIVGVIVYIYAETPCLSHVTRRTARMSLLWPGLLVIISMRTILLILNELIAFVSIVIGCNYRDSKMCDSIEKKLLL